MKQALLGVLTSFLLGTAGLWGALIKESVIAPLQTEDPMSATDIIDPFANSPIYPLGQISQVAKQGDWTSYEPEDYQADLRLLWDTEALYLRFDITDDTHRPILEPDLEAPLIGDFIRVSFRHRTVGANRRAEAPWQLYLFPNFRDNSCQVKLNVPDKVTAARLGDASDITTRVFTFQERVSILVRIPVDSWEDPTRRGGLLKFQVLYFDDDTAEEETDIDAVPEIDHILSYFPIDRSQRLDVLPQFGEIMFAEATWIALRPTRVMYPEGRLEVLADYANLTDETVSAIITVVPDDGTTTTPIKTFDGIVDLPPGTVAQNQTLSLPMEDVPGGRYRLNANVRHYYAPNPIIVDKPQGHNLLFLRQHIEWQPKTATRDLPLYTRREMIKESYRYMAGGGQVLWSVGQYDASSREFRQVLRDKGPYELTLPDATSSNLPWALFGGLDNLDGMNEPLVIKLDETLFADDQPLQPQMPEFSYLENDRLTKRKAVRSRRLLLLGLAYDYVDEYSFPEIEVRAGRRLVARERLLGSPDAPSGDRRLYVLRLWLEENERELRISNIAPFGPKAEIDFMAFIGPGERTGFPEDSASLSFSGSEEAELFSRQLATSLFFMRHYLVDRTGVGYSSLPGGNLGAISDRDFGLLLQELATWGAQDEARRLASQIPRRASIMRETFNRTGQMSLGYPTLLIGMHELWRHMEGDRNNFLRRIWLSSVHQPVTDLITNMGRNPHSLVEATGELGVPPGESASTLAMALASRAALIRASEMAETIGQTSDRWQREAQRLNTQISRHLIAPTGGLSIYSPRPYPESYGIPAQDSVQALVNQNAWLYGLYRTGKPVLYNGDIRVFDTPYVLAGTPFFPDAEGYHLSDQQRLAAQTTLNYLYIVSPLLQGGQRSFLASNILDYNNSDVQLWTAYTALMIDNFTIGSRMLDAYIRYTFDEYAMIPDDPRADIEISPYTFEHKLNSGPHGENLGASGDDLNVMTSTLAMRTARLILGLDDSSLDIVRLSPRLPDNWSQVQTQAWPLAHQLDRANSTKVDLRYSRLVNDRYTLSLTSEAELAQLEVRFGPFPGGTRRVEVTTAGNRERISTDVVNGQAWATATFRNVRELEVAVKPTF